MKKDTTNTQATIETKNEKHLRRELMKLSHNLQEKRRKQDRRDAWLNGGMLTLLGTLSVLGLVVGNWLGVLINLGTALWVCIVWMKEKHINFLTYMIDYQFGLRYLETKQLILAKKGKQ